MNAEYGQRSGKMSALGPALNELLAEGGQLIRSKSGLAAEIWPQIVGPWYARHTAVIALKQKELRVYCDSPAVAQQLQADQETIIARLNERLGGRYVQRLRPASVGPREARAIVRTGLEAFPDLPSEAELAALPIPEERLQAFCERLAQIPNERLRHVALQAYERWLRLEEWKRRRGWRLCPLCGCRHDGLAEICRPCQILRQQPHLR